MQLVKKDMSLTVKAQKEIVKIENGLKMLKAKEQEYREEILKIMQDNNIKKFESDELLITYKDEYDVETFDKTKFKKENQDLYDQYVKMTTRKPSVMIKVK